MSPANEQFLEFLAKSQKDLAAIMAVIKKWLELQTPPVPQGSGSGPQEFHVGETAPLTTVALSNEEIDQLQKEMADAVVKDKAIACVKAFLAGLLIGA